MVLFLFWQILCALGFIFLICDLGYRISNAFGKIDYTIVKLNWYKFPIEIKKLLPILIIGAQQPVELEVFGSVSCSYEIFQTVSLNNRFTRVSYSLHK